MMFNGVKLLEKVYQTTDGKVHGSIEDANDHQNSIIVSESVTRLYSCITSSNGYINRSDLKKFLNDHGFVYDLLKDKFKSKIYDSSTWTG